MPVAVEVGAGDAVVREAVARVDRIGKRPVPVAVQHPQRPAVSAHDQVRYPVLVHVADRLAPGVGADRDVRSPDQREDAAAVVQERRDVLEAVLAGHEVHVAVQVEVADGELVELRDGGAGHGADHCAGSERAIALVDEQLDLAVAHPFDHVDQAVPGEIGRRHAVGGESRLAGGRLGPGAERPGQIRLEVAGLLGGYHHHVPACLYERNRLRVLGAVGDHVEVDVETASRALGRRPFRDPLHRPRRVGGLIEGRARRDEAGGLMAQDLARRVNLDHADRAWVQLLAGQASVGQRLGEVHLRFDSGVDEIDAGRLHDSGQAGVPGVQSHRHQLGLCERAQVRDLVSKGVLDHRPAGAGPRLCHVVDHPHPDGHVRHHRIGVLVDLHGHQDLALGDLQGGTGQVVALVLLLDLVEGIGECVDIDVSSVLVDNPCH